MLTVIAGCSWIGVSPPAQNKFAKARPECTESVAAPVVDTVAAALYAAIAVAGVSGLVQESSDECSDSGEFCLDLDFTELFVTMAAAGGLAAAVHTGSAVYGYSNTAECREAVRAWEARARSGQPGNARAPAPRPVGPTMEVLP